MEYGKWFNYNSEILDNRYKVLVRRKGYGDTINLCTYNKLFNCFDDECGDRCYSRSSVDKIFIIPKIT